jgi:hypothetical protein
VTRRERIHHTRREINSLDRGVENGQVTPHEWVLRSAELRVRLQRLRRR